MKKNQTPEEIRLNQKKPHCNNPETGKARRSKIDSILNLLLIGKSLNRFEAERYGDHCLHSTISELRNHYRFEILDEWEVVPNRFGGETKVKRYWLGDKARSKALRFLRRHKRTNNDETPECLGG